MKIFFAIDGSPESLAAVRQVGQLLSPQADAAAFYFAPPDVLVLESTRAKQLQEQAVAMIAAEVFAEAQRLLPGTLGSGAKTIVSESPPREGILTEASRWGADLIVVGARGMSAVERVLLGSVSRAVAYRSGLPVYVARPCRKHNDGEPFRVLFAYDGSECCKQALCAAQGLTYPPGTQVLAATVGDLVAAELPQWIAQSRPSAQWDPVVKHWLEEAEADKREKQQELAVLMKRQKSPFDHAEVVVAEGLPTDQLLKLIDSRRIDLVILGSGGKAAWQRLLLGSTSEQVLNHAPCSVLLARQRHLEQTADG